MRNGIGVFILLIIVGVLFSPPIKLVSTSPSNDGGLLTRFEPTRLESPNPCESWLPYTPSTDYQPHAPISISSDSDFISQGWPGNGTSNNPYRIEGLSISTTESCISIVNTTAFFKVSDCELQSPATASGNGLVLTNVSNGQVRLCHIISKTTGIVVTKSHDMTLNNNSFADASTGLQCENSQVDFLGNTLDGLWDGVYLKQSPNCTISWNSFRMVGSLWIVKSSSCTLTSNRITTYGFDSWSRLSPGIRLYNSPACDLTSNELHMTGLMINGTSNDWHQQLEDNSINGKELLYFWAVNNTVLDMSTAGQVIVANSHDLLLEHGYFVNASSAVVIAFSQHIHVEGEESFECAQGVYVLQSDGCDIEQVNIHTLARGISTRTVNGVTFSGCRNCQLLNSEIYLTDSAVTITGSADCSASSNHLYSNIEGVVCRASSGINVSGNVIHKSWTNGIELYSCINCEVVQNFIYESEEKSGIFITGLCSILVIDNVVIDNAMAGIYVFLCNGNLTIYGNSIGWNGEENAGDFYYTYPYTKPTGIHLWDDGISIGNKWSDYNGTGKYKIPGEIGAVDQYPQLLSERPTLPSASVTPSNTTTPNLNLLSIVITGISVIIIIVMLVLIIRHRKGIG